MTSLGRIIFRFFLVALAAAAALMAVYDLQVSRDIEESLVEARVEEGARQVEQFQRDLSRSLEKHGFLNLIQETRDDFLEFEELSNRLLKQNSYISYIHWKNDRGETMLYKGPDHLHRITVQPDGVAYYSATTSEVREIRIEASGPVEGIASVTAPLGSVDRSLGSVSVGFSKERIRAEGEEALRRIRRRTVLFGAVAVSLVGLAFVLSIRQLSRIQGLEQRLLESRRLAELGTMASGLVHEIRNPINGVNLNLGLLEDEMVGLPDARLKTRVAALLDRIKPSMGHLESLASEFLHYARPPRVQIAEDSLNEVVKLVADFLRPQALRAGVRVTLDFDPRVTPFPLDREIVKQVILNFAMNAIQEMTGGGELALSTTNEGTEARVTVADTGRGLAPAERDRVFELFYSTKEGGVGLGLPIARRLARDHGGRIEVESEPGAGSRFSLVLPLRPALPEGEPAGAGADAGRLARGGWGGLAPPTSGSGPSSTAGSTGPSRTAPLDGTSSTGGVSPHRSGEPRTERTAPAIRGEPIDGR